MKKKKLNPRRIPMSKALVDKNAILEEATQDDMYRAWLLVVHSILELELLPADEIAALADSVNKCIASTSAYDSAAIPVRVRRGAFSDRAQKSRDSELQRAENLMGIAVPYDHLNPDHIHSAVQLEAFKKKSAGLPFIRRCASFALGWKRRKGSPQMNCVVFFSMQT